MATATAPTNIVDLEQRRIEEEMLRNEQRFYAYNQRRIKHGLTPLSSTEFYCRKHGYAAALDRLHRKIDAQNIPAFQPQHRDDVALYTR